MSWPKNLFFSKKRVITAKERVIPVKTEQFFKKLCEALENCGEKVEITKDEKAEWVAPWIALTPDGPGQIIICAYRAGHVEITIPALNRSDKYLNFFLEKCPYRILGPEDLDQADPEETVRRLHRLASEYERVAYKIEKWAKEEKIKVDSDFERAARLQISLLLA
jgi:hypothetical protein